GLLVGLIGLGRCRSLLASTRIAWRRRRQRIAARRLIGRRRWPCRAGSCACLARRFAKRRFKPLGHIGKVPTGCAFATAGGDRGGGRGGRGRLRGRARFEPGLRALVLPLFVALVLTGALADIAAITLWRDPCGKLVGKGGQGVALARSGLGLWPAWKIV